MEKFIKTNTYSIIKYNSFTKDMEYEGLYNYRSIDELMPTYFKKMFKKNFDEDPFYNINNVKESILPEKSSYPDNLEYGKFYQSRNPRFSYYIYVLGKDKKLYGLTTYGSGDIPHLIKRIPDQLHEITDKNVISKLKRKFIIHNIIDES